MKDLQYLVKALAGTRRVLVGLYSEDAEQGADGK